MLWRLEARGKPRVRCARGGVCDLAHSGSLARASAHRAATLVATVDGSTQRGYLLLRRAERAAQISHLGA